MPKRRNHERLNRRLAALAPEEAATCLGLLWSYFKEFGLVQVENEIRARWGHPVKLPPHPEELFQTVSFETTRAELAALAGEVDFDVLALRWLKGLDQKIAQLFPEQYDDLLVEGLDGRRYKLCRRNDFIAESYGETEERVVYQSLSLAAYSRFHKLVPIHPVEGRTIDCRSENDWLPPDLQDRLEDVRLAELPTLRVLLWPFRTELDFGDCETLRDGVRWVRLHTIKNEGELVDEIEEAFAAARKEEATILILPELVIPPTVEERIHGILEGHGREGYPMLTVFGCCHCQSEDDPRIDVNEAVVLGPDGTELHRHRKLAAFTDRERGIAERIKVGDRLSVLETRLGNLVPLICLDLPNVAILDLLKKTHGNVLLTPSLSPQTSAHDSAAKQLQIEQLASTFVCNRRFDQQPTADSPSGTSFFRVPRAKDAHVAHFPKHAKRPNLLFKLAPKTKAKKPRWTTQVEIN